MAGGLAAWKFWPQIAPTAGGNAGTPAVQGDTNAPNGETGQAVTNAASSTTQSHPAESSPTQNVLVNSGSESTGSQGASVDDKSAAETSASSRGSQRSDQTSDVVRKNPPAKHEPKAVSRGNGFAEALLRARDDENQGKYEDALREYEQAATLDPSDTALKQHIKHLREQVAKENELIH